MGGALWNCRFFAGPSFNKTKITKPPQIGGYPKNIESSKIGFFFAGSTKKKNEKKKWVKRMVHALGARGEAAGLSVTVFVSGAAAGAGGATYVSRDG